MKNYFKIILILLFAFLLASNAFADVEIFDITSAQQHPQFTKMPEPLKQLFIMLEPAKVNLPIFYASKEIALKKQVFVWNGIGGNETLRVEPMQPPDPYPIAGMKAEYFVPKNYRDPANDGKYGLRIAYYYINSKGEKVTFASIYAMYMPPGKYADEELKYRKSGIETYPDNPPYEKTKIRGIPMVVRRAKVKFVESAVIYKPIVYKEVNYIDNAQFVYGRFWIEIWSNEVSQLYEYIFYEGSKLQESSTVAKTEDVTKSRDIEPLINDLINYISGAKYEEPVLETFLDLKLSKDSVPADGKSTVKLTGKLRTKENKPVAGYPVTVNIDPLYGKISPDKVTTGANGSFQFIYTAPQTSEVKEFPGQDKLSVQMRVTAENPKTGKIADTSEVYLSILPAENPGIEIFMHDEQDNPVYDKVNLGYNLKGKQELKTVFVNNEGKLFYPLPQGTKVNVIYKDDIYLIFTQAVTVPAKVDILRTTLKDYTKNLQKKMNGFLKKAGFSDEEAKKIIDAKINFDSSKSNPTYDAMDKAININGANIKKVKDLVEFEKAFTHEIGHFISDNIIDPTGFYLKGIPLQGKWVGGSHNTWVPAQDESKELAFEEAGAEFFSQLFYKSEKEIYDNGFENAGMSQGASSKYMQPGNVIEGNIASFLCAYYKDDLKNPQAVYKDFSDTIKKYEEFYTSFRPVRNIEEFLDAKLNATSPGLKYSGELKGLASKYKIMATNVWEAVLSSPDAVKKIKVLRGKETLDFMPSMTLKKGDKIEVPAGGKVAFQKFSDGWWENGDKDWVSFGPGTHNVEIDDGYNYIKVEYGKAQFVNTSAVSADGKTLIKKDGTNYIVEVDENKNTKVAVLGGAVILQNKETKQEQKIAVNQTAIITPGKPLAPPMPSAPQTSALQETQWWKMPTEVIIGTPAATVTAQDDGIKRTSLKGGLFKVWVPEGWKVDENPKNSLLEISTGSGTNLIQLLEIKIDKEKAPEDYVEKIMSAWEKEMVGPDKMYYRRMSSEKIKIGQIDAYENDYNLRSNNIEYFGQMIFFGYKDKIYLLNTIIWADELYKYRDIYEKIAKSLIVN